MNYTKISRKQANVIYRNVKEGNIMMKDELVTFMYERADAHLSYNTLDDATETYLLGAVDAIFKNDFSKAQECIDSAWISFGSTHGLLETETITTEDIAAPVEAEATCTSAGSENTTEWTFKGCKVHEEECDGDLHCFVVTMERDGEVRTQTAIPTSLQDMENARRNLNEGISPLDGWEDGMGNEICWENGEEVE